MPYIVVVLEAYFYLKHSLLENPVVEIHAIIGVKLYSFYFGDELKTWWTKILACVLKAAALSFLTTNE